MSAPAATRFGRSMLAHWPLDPAITYLNHGTVGVAPRGVLAAQQALREEIERQPSRFMLRELSGQMPARGLERPRIRTAAASVATFVGARDADLVFVDNATSGANAVLRSFPLAAGDEILATELGYGAVTLAATHSARQAGATVRVMGLPWPPEAGTLATSIEAALGPRTRLVIVDHIAAESALVLPLADIAARCRARGVAVLADGAHAPGQLDLDVPSLGVDWYTANLHKWAWAPRGCGFLWAAPERQAGLHPPVISWGLDQGFTAEFDWVGTRDPSPWLAAPAALDLMREVGVGSVRAWGHDLAWRGAHHLAQRWGTRFEAPRTMTASMATVPLPERFGSTREAAQALRDALLYEDAIEVALHAWRGRLWTRISAQVYNELDDVERLAAAVLARG